MAGIIYIPSANADDDLTGAILDSDAGPGTTSTGLTNGTEYRAYALSNPSDPFTPTGSLTADNTTITSDETGITADST